MSSPEQNYFLRYAMRYPVCSPIQFTNKVQKAGRYASNKYRALTKFYMQLYKNKVKNLPVFWTLFLNCICQFLAILMCTNQVQKTGRFSSNKYCVLTKFYMQLYKVKNLPVFEPYFWTLWIVLANSLRREVKVNCIRQYSSQIRFRKPADIHQIKFTNKVQKTSRYS